MLIHQRTLILSNLQFCAVYFHVYFHNAVYSSTPGSLLQRLKSKPLRLLGSLRVQIELMASVTLIALISVPPKTEIFSILNLWCSTQSWRYCQTKCRNLACLSPHSPQPALSCHTSVVDFLHFPEGIMAPTAEHA